MFSKLSSSAAARERLKVLAAGIACLILSLGVARFAYTPLLPLMQSQAGLGAAEGGWLAAWNYAGYLTGALAASMISDLVLKDRLYRIGLLLAVVSTVAMANAESLAWWSAWRFVAGLASAAGMLLGTGLVLHWLVRHEHRPELGIHFAGVGLGIALCALLVDGLAASLDWQSLWLAFAALGAVLLIPALGWLPAPDTSGTTRSGRPMPDAPPGRAFMAVLLAAYFCAGVGFVVSATFIVAIVDAQPGLAGRGGSVFLLLGLAAMPACIVWDRVARRIGMLNALLATCVLQIGGILLPALGAGLAAAALGAVLFGATFIGTVSLVLTMAGRYYPTRPAKMMGRMTISYGIAQIAAPAVTGWLAARGGSYADGLYLAAAVMVLGSALLALLKLLDAHGAPDGRPRAEA